VLLGFGELLDGVGEHNLGSQELFVLQRTRQGIPTVPLFFTLFRMPAICACGAAPPDGALGFLEGWGDMGEAFGGSPKFPITDIMSTSVRGGRHCDLGTALLCLPGGLLIC